MVRTEMVHWGFNIKFKDKNTLNEVLRHCDSMSSAHRSISEKKVQQLKNELNGGFLSMDMFRWLNTWIVTKDKTRYFGYSVANKISKILFGVDRDVMPRIDGQEGLQIIKRSNREILNILSETFKRQLGSK